MPSVFSHGKIHTPKQGLVLWLQIRASEAELGKVGGFFGSFCTNAAPLHLNSEVECQQERRNLHTQTQASDIQTHNFLLINHMKRPKEITTK